MRRVGARTASDGQSPGVSNPSNIRPVRGPSLPMSSRAMVGGDRRIAGMTMGFVIEKHLATSVLHDSQRHPEPKHVEDRDSQRHPEAPGHVRPPRHRVLRDLPDYCSSYLWTGDSSSTPGTPFGHTCRRTRLCGRRSTAARFADVPTIPEPWHEARRRAICLNRQASSAATPHALT